MAPFIVETRRIRRTLMVVVTLMVSGVTLTRKTTLCPSSEMAALPSFAVVERWRSLATFPMRLFDIHETNEDRQDGRQWVAKTTFWWGISPSKAFGTKTEVSWLIGPPPEIEL